MREVMLIVHFIGLAMGLGTSIGMIFLGIAGSKLEKEERIKFAINSFALGKMGQIGIVLLIISGLYLLVPFMFTLASNPYLIIKLVLVVLLVVLLLLINSTTNKIKGGDFSQVPKLQNLGKIALLTALAIVVCAVISFK